MSKLFYHVMQDNLGNLLFDVSGTMRVAGTGTLATIYGDEGLTVIIANPMTNHPSFGSFKCFLGAGDYDFYMAKSGYTFETLTGVQGHGTLAQQDASDVAITGGNASLNSLSIPAPGAIYCAGTATFDGEVQLRKNQVVSYAKALTAAFQIRPTDSDTAGGVPFDFRNVVNTTVGSINTNATATTFNTSSDARLKHAIAPLTGALDVMRALKPITHLWRADDARGVGFLAHEVAEVVDGVISGERDAVDDDGRIVPQQIDYSKLVPWPTAALQEAVAQVQALTARVATLEDGLGL